MGFVSLPVTYSTARRMPVGSWKVCHFQHHGAYLKDSCTVYQKLEAVCIVMSWNDRQGVWEGSHSGCPQGTSQMVTVPVERHKGAEALNISHISFTVRSAEDPYLVAGNLTNGELHFGATRHQRLSTATFLLVLSLGSLTIVLALLACCCYEACYFADEDCGPYVLPANPSPAWQRRPMPNQSFRQRHTYENLEERAIEMRCLVGPHGT
eukprot:NODE_2197_length_969_cov_43.118478_g1807_i0.p1 GENE.NODE_2197_length_969_cov_43.118478_g1807_i0~~NODE_2197_length_969_cov_43.118478_g1807_i0.p1  ORF type:complete len:209 (+),score=38.43 NODE_2197_length_969_cov_43.118478_g1807_i0:286-912(+)